MGALGSISALAGRNKDGTGRSAQAVVLQAVLAALLLSLMQGLLLEGAALLPWAGEATVR